MFSGSLVALVTPFTSENILDKNALAELVEWQIASGTDGIVCLGTTGEAPTLSEKEKCEVIRTCIEVNKGRVPIIVGTGTYATKASVENTLLAKEMGADGALVIVPYYNRPSEEGCYEHFKAINSLPLIVYHHPFRTGITLSPSTIAKIRELEHVVGLKEGPSDIQWIKEVQKLCDIPIFSGDDLNNFAVLQEGGAGVISAAANVIPKEIKKQVSLAQQKKFQLCKEESLRIHPTLKALFSVGNPQGIKYGVSLQKQCLPKLRLPLLKPQVKVQREIQKALEALFTPAQM